MDLNSGRQTPGLKSNGKIFGLQTIMVNDDKFNIALNNKHYQEKSSQYNISLFHYIVIKAEVGYIGENSKRKLDFESIQSAL